MTKDELEKEAEEINITYENNVFHCTKNGTKWISIDGEKWYGEEKRIEELEKENRLLGERCNQLLKDKGNLTDELKNWKDEWQEQVQKAIDEGYARTLQTIQLTKAKDHIKKLLDCLKQDTNDPQTNYYVCQYMDKAEQFLKEIEKGDRKMKDEEMADKHAEEYRKTFRYYRAWHGQVVDKSPSTIVEQSFKDGFLAGLKAGRPQWHYVKDGDYPDTDRTVLAYSDDVVSGHYPYFAQYYKGFTNAKKNGVDLNWNCWRNNMQRELVEPTVWCEIPTFDKE